MPKSPPSDPVVGCGERPEESVFALYEKAVSLETFIGSRAYPEGVRLSGFGAAEQSQRNTLWNAAKRDVISLLVDRHLTGIALRDDASSSVPELVEPRCWFRAIFRSGLTELLCGDVYLRDPRILARPFPLATGAADAANSGVKKIRGRPPKDDMLIDAIRTAIKDEPNWLDKPPEARDRDVRKLVKGRKFGSSTLRKYEAPFREAYEAASTKSRKSTD